MSLYNGRKRGSLQAPRRTRERWEVRFWFHILDPKTNKRQWGWTGGNFSVEKPIELNLKQYVRDWKMANLGIAHKIKKITYKRLGADI